MSVVNTNKLRQMSTLRLSMSGDVTNVCIIQADNLLAIADELDQLRSRVDAGRFAASAIRAHLKVYPNQGSDNFKGALTRARKTGLLGNKE